MKNKNKLLIAIGLIVASCNTNHTATDVPLYSVQSEFVNLIDVKNEPQYPRDYNVSVFSDKGAWGGYALPIKQSSEFAGSFIGPLSLGGRGWIAKTLARPFLMVNNEPYRFAYSERTSEYLPGKLVQNYRDAQLDFTTELCFGTDRTAFVRSAVTNLGAEPITLSFNWKGGVFPNSAVLTNDGNRLYIRHLPDSIFAIVDYRTAEKIQLTNADSVSVVEKQIIILQPNDKYQADYSQTLLFKHEDVENELQRIEKVNSSQLFAENREFWDSCLKRLLDRDSKFLKKNDYRKVAVKAMMTLNSNWRSAAGDIIHGGSFPSYNGFWGVWSWDAWKIASGNTLYNPEIAKDDMRSLFDYQADNGMVPDYIGYNKRYNNWRDSKPPVAAWGAMNVFLETGDLDFLKEMFDKLYRFHRWWYKDRDHNKNGVCEYGSTDGSLIAAAWESGMDNGVRFDHTKMLKNGEKAWSMNQENICLNSFLYKEKRILAEMAEKLNRKDLSDLLNDEADKLKEYIQTKMFDEETGFFYDINIESGDFIKVMGAEGWLPLWAGVATEEQAAAVVKNMMNPLRFNSTLPLGTLEVSHKELKPVFGYWRGPVWVDQVYFGIKGLRNYGYVSEADYLLEKFIHNAQGLMSDGTINENYNPLTGEAINCPNFGWSSALIIKMLLMN